MVAINIGAAAVPHSVTPESDNAHLAVGEVGKNRKADNRHFAQTTAERKRIDTLTARAALAGLVLEPLADGAWQMLNQTGQPATVQSLQAAEALVYGCELVRADVAGLMGRLVRLQGAQ